MGLLDQVIGNAISSRMGAQQGGTGGGPGAGMEGSSSPLIMALLTLLGSGAHQRVEGWRIRVLALP